jgi:hypothetical protein
MPENGGARGACTAVTLKGWSLSASGGNGGARFPGLMRAEAMGWRPAGVAAPESKKPGTFAPGFHEIGSPSSLDIEPCASRQALISGAFLKMFASLALRHNRLA